MGINPPNHGPNLRLRSLEYDLISPRISACRLVSSRPETIVLEVTDIEELSLIIQGSIAMPAGDGNILPPANACTRTGDHHVVVAVGEKMHIGQSTARITEDSHRTLAIQHARPPD